jgi:hypothetical protein
MATGWTWDYVWETMTFQKLEAFGRMWRKSPPPHVALGQLSFMVRTYLGFKDKDSEPDAPPILPGFITQSDFEE